jgi:hypothetical protein
MKILSFLYLTLLMGTVMVFSSCFKDLDTVPLDRDEFTSEIVYDDPESYKKVLGKLYAGLAISGQQGENSGDISGIDNGFGQYLRGYWYHQELTTDEAVIGWNDQTIKDFHELDWGPSDVFINAFYSRIFYQISLCNEFLRETSDEKLSSRNVPEAVKAEVRTYRAEARFLRALSYWHALDLFRNVPFVTEEDKVGAFFPEQISKDDLYTYIEAELKEVESLLPAANEYGRAGQAAAWSLLAKLYLNAEVYTGKAAYTDCITYCTKVINAGYSLEPEFSHLFLADNHNSNEIIFPVISDGRYVRTWGGTTFIVHASVGGDMNTADFGIGSGTGWGGIRTTSAIVGKFPAVGGGSVVVSPNEGGTYPQLELPGSYQGWAPDNAETVYVVASTGSNNQYEGYGWLEGGAKFKFTQGGTWDVNWGDTGADFTLDAGGTDIEVAETGFYRFTVDLDALTYTMTKTDWGIIGDATAGGWDSDQNMTYDVTERAWVITTDLIGGTFKFRANDDWALNYGDTGADALLDRDGDNISIPSAGNYLIKLYLDKPDYTYSIEIPSFDKRAMFYTSGQSLEIDDIGQFTNGYAVTKFKNLTSAGVAGSDPVHVDTDFPMFRLGDIYLMYAEAVLRGGSGGDLGTALNYVNAVRERAYGGTSGNITASQLTLDFIIDERARELMWECHRRTDLVRFNNFTTSNYLWPWKGGEKEGVGVDSKYNVFPIPSNDLGANPNLVQNQGY